jgi:hypothetical protein
MNYLLCGGESAERVTLLLELTRITSVDKINAINAYLVDGVPATRARARFGVSQQSWHKGISKLNKTAVVVETLFELKH